MIDHIVLHREERVAPLEVSRSKLSRHLQGLVFRCHKCTFTCSSDQTLQMHLQKHAEVKPYQCQLCYYDSSLRSKLEEHLRLEHKVIRNFELMGRVNLDQLEMIKEQGSSAEEEDVPEMMEMVVDGENALKNGDEVMDVNEAEEPRDIDNDEVMEDHFQETAEEDANEEEVKELKEEEPEKPALREVLASPTCNSGTGPSSEGGKRLPCEFCGRCFTNSIEWERHVLRHGMVVNSSQIDTSNTSAIEAPSSICSSVLLDSGLDLSNNRTEEEDLPNESQRSQSQYVEDKEILDTKKDQQFD